MTFSAPVRRTVPAAADGKVGRVLELLRRSFFVKAEAEPEESAKLFVSEEAVTRAIDAWHERSVHLPAPLLSDPAWRMLLELLEAEIQNRRVSSFGLYNVSGVNARAAARWLRALEAQGLVLRRPDPLQHEFVELSRRGSSALRDYFHAIRDGQ